ncbi:LysE family translocator [Rhodobacter capsulatus]|uniref:Transporter, LysE family n=1 Tax=Rhodobacter capsulatus (strain ATCC BAA-309 / NBRC 16581 / SB1003) TaxID=272942 RepID=D5ASQ5_RHOCB|nr:LysE family translocator [Rhodobacter capsulatus]ADE87146.1 transporter, LysE family [Rhodobacter capsulatus SB 1003]ETD03376.1 RhtB family transporter [Rhodobacter capsulatus DE442]ETD80171.1 RhtB family transporter [Rhodobacter capsulatus R121]ETD87947.1 RhtB family transporter [Rhodobacter capsulatus YW2]ETE55435.1 RhtB family transporter [Rhodobacter capsulatus Y262]
MSPEFLFTAFIVCLVPGIGVVYTLSSTLGQGFRAGLWASLGCTIATLVHLAVALGGLAAVLHTSALLFQTIKYAGVAYLLYMAWGTLKGTGGLALEAAAPQSVAQLVWRGIVLNLLNPKLPLFFVAFLPQFMAVNDGPFVMAELGVVFAVLTFLTFLGYTALAASGRQAILSRPAVMAWMRRAFAASFAALGVRLAFERA